MFRSVSEDLDSGFEAIVNSLREGDAFIQELRKTFQRLTTQFDPTAIDYCLSRYIEAELDFVTPGDRGIGRVSPAIPRFGAYYRKPLSKLPPTDIVELGNRMCSLMFQGYLAAALLASNFSPDTGKVDKDVLFNRWVPTIYSSPPTDRTLQVVIGVAERGFHRLKEYVRSRNLVGGGFFTRDKTDGILVYYPLSGHALRCAVMEM